MENRLIYRKSGSPETQSEKPEFKGDGRKEYKSISDRLDVIAKSEEDKKNPILLGEMIDKVGALYSDLANSETGIIGAYNGGNFFRELFQKIEGTFDLQSIEKVSPYYRTLVKRVHLFADPDGYAKRLVEDTKLTWDEGTIKNFCNDIFLVADFYKFQSLKYGENYVRIYLSEVYTRYYSELEYGDTETVESLDQNFRTWLTYNKDNFKFEVNTSLKDWPEGSRTRLYKLSADFYIKGKSVKNKKDFDEFFAELGPYNNGDNKLVKDVLSAGDLSSTGGIDENDPMYYAPPLIYMSLIWKFYLGLTENSHEGIDNDQLQTMVQPVSDAHDEIYSMYPELQPVDVVGSLERTRASNDVSQGLTKPELGGQADEFAKDISSDQESHIPLYNLGEKPSDEVLKLTSDLMSTESNLSDLKSAIIAKLEAGEIDQSLSDKLLQEMGILRAQLKQLYGIEQIVSLNPNIEQQAKEAADYYEAFAMALQNAAMLPDFEKQLDKFSAMKEISWADYFGELEHVYHTLRFSSYLPNEAVRKYKVLLERADQLYTKWAAVLHLPPKAVIAPSPFETDRDRFYDEESDEYEYSPMIDIASNDEQLREAVEIPEIMHIQLSRLEVIRTLANSLLKVEELTDGDDKVYANSIMRDLDGIETELVGYYTGEEYDGLTPFKLDEEIQSRNSFRIFIGNLKDLFTPEYAKGPQIKGAGPLTQFEEYVADKHNLHDLRNFVANIARIGKGYDWQYSSLMKLLTGGDDLDMETIKYAGVIVVKLEREYFKDVMAARVLMAKLLQPHMAKSRQHIPETVRRNGYHRAREKATREVRNYMGLGGAAQVEQQIRHALKKERPDIPENEIRPLTQQAYTQFWDAMIEAQTDVLYQAFLDHTALSKDNFDFFGKADHADLMIKRDFVDSVDPDKENWNWADETLNFVGTLVKELAISGVAMIAALLAGAGVSLLILRWGRFLLNLRRFATIGRFLYRGLILIKWGAEGWVFHDVCAGIKGEKSLLEMLEKGQYEKFARGLVGQMAFFGVVHGVNWVNRFMKQGSVGRGLMWLSAKDPATAEYVNKVLATAASKTPADAVRALEDIVKNGVKLAGRKLPQKLPPEVVALLNEGLQNVSLMRERYFRIIQGLPGGKDSPVRKVCGVLLQDLQFDALAMLLGSYANNMALDDEMRQEIDLTTAETWIGIYTTAAAFRGAFTVVQKGGRWAHERLNAEAPEEFLPTVRKAISAAETSKKALDFCPSQKKIDELRIRIQSLRAEAKKKKTTARKLRSEVGKLETEVATLESDLASLRSMFDSEIAKLKAQEQEIEAAMRAPRRLGDFVVPSKIARIMPRWLRQHFYNRYVDKEGKFLGSDGLTDVLLGRRSDMTFEEGVVMIRSSKRLLLSVNQVLVVASKLSPEQMQAFLEACAGKMTRRQIRLFMDMAKSMEITEVPESFNPEPPPRYRNNSTLLERFRKAKWREALLEPLRILAVVGLLGGAGEGSKKPTERPPHVLVVEAKDFEVRSKGKFAVTESDFDALPEAGKDSKYVLFEGKPSETPDAKAWDAQKAQSLFTKDANADQQKIIDNLRKASAPNEVVMNIQNMFDSLPDAIKPYIRIFATVDDDNETKPYVVIDQEGLDKGMKAELAKIFEGYSDLGILGTENPEKIMKIVQKNHPEVMMMMGSIHALPFLLWFGKQFFGRPGGNALLYIGIAWYALAAGKLPIDSIPVIGPLINILGGAIIPYPHNILDAPWGWALPILMFWRSKFGYDLINRIRGKNPETDKDADSAPGETIGKDKLPELVGNKDCCLESIPDDSALLGDARVKADRKVLEDFYKELKDIFSTRLKFTTVKEGQDAFVNLVRWKYNEIRIKQLQDILDITNLDPNVKAQREVELDFLIKAQNNLKPEIAKIPEIISYVSPVGRAEMIKFATAYVDKAMNASDKLFTSVEITQVKKAVEAIINILNRYPDLFKKLDRVRMMEKRLEALDPAYKKAVDTLNKPAPASDAPVGVKKIRSDAVATKKVYEDLKESYDREMANLSWIRKNISLKLSKVLSDDPVKRKVMIGIIVAALVAAGIFVPRLLPSKQPQQKPSESDKQKEGDDRKAGDDSADGIKDLLDENDKLFREYKEDDDSQGVEGGSSQKKPTPKTKTSQKDASASAPAESKPAAQNPEIPNTSTEKSPEEIKREVINGL